jgi:diaminohydroxyphosphoribosylaminopyrimidine deaminase/5-amino-6-(5-phosphoribosylamino)uracil reductase
LPTGSALVRSAGELPLAVVVAPGAPAQALAAAGVEVIEAERAADALAELGRRACSSLLVEGGAGLAGGLLSEGLIDRLALFVAPIVLGDGPGLVSGWAAASLDQAVRAASLTARAVGPDTLLVAELHEP